MIDPAHAVAKENIQRRQSVRIAHWHFDMLADQARNDAYDAALQKAASGRRVLDIGTGSGLLAMMAARAGAEAVTACEMSAPIAKVASQILADNGMDQRVQLHHKKSTGLRVGEEMAVPADLLVSEILDVGLLGEGVIPSLRHAKENLLTPDAVLIPAAATVKGYLFQSDHQSKVNPVGTISGFDLSAFNAFRIPHEYLRVQGRMLPHEPMSELRPLWAIDFYQLPPVAATTQPNLHHLEVKATRTGKVHGLLFWFDLQLDEDIQLSTGPDGDMIHWGQAAFFFPEAVTVESGQALTLVVEQSDMGLKFGLKK